LKNVLRLLLGIALIVGGLIIVLAPTIYQISSFADVSILKSTFMVLGGLVATGLVIALVIYMLDIGFSLIIDVLSSRRD
jgi:cytochrome c oxidase subunit IV